MKDKYLVVKLPFTNTRSATEILNGYAADRYEPIHFFPAGGDLGVVLEYKKGPGRPSSKDKDTEE